MIENDDVACHLLRPVSPQAKRAFFISISTNISL